MSERLLADAKAAPDLFSWNGSISRDLLEDWVAALRWRIPSDLVEFWVATGGGEVFESERLLRPLKSKDGRASVAIRLPRLNRTGNSKRIRRDQWGELSETPGAKG
jgi:hypothetical protein